MCLQRKQQLLETDIAHDLRLGISHESREARQAASEAIQAMQISRAQVEALWDALRGSDRESSGKVTVSELTKAFRTAGVQVGVQRMVWHIACSPLKEYCVGQRQPCTHWQFIAWQVVVFDGKHEA